MLMRVEDLPHTLRSFPRSDYTIARHRKTRHPGKNTDAAIAAGARRATRAWVAAARTGRWGNVDSRCIVLVILDKVIEINASARSYSCSWRRNHPNPAAWRQTVLEYIRIAYELASAVRSLPSFQLVCTPVAQAMEWFWRTKDSAVRLSASSLPHIDLPQLLGQFYFPLGSRVQLALRDTSHDSSIDAIVGSLTRLEAPSYSI
ncbi:hypothetical protein CC85DRAFT_287308 [Cutaneotrichosporon oleaginosum]|uniref:Uncharacterized protein n=1 Tax=Cutaneotrichosporon oleaginosum TaxID=879819 RepID=A0A0J0XHU8_9TREE|nr:uncharacterized protein CC85DRAFT_287308 [Cutaneotrichosporon oleaginosum]KLT40582.1 hypothetical protein CC85DRAFT_287308 [Cutaneotrichosporon oleaginosum]TXT03908.1 hypothetical protein COLE_07605 [Cutaneotrichosporon oleaginosum]